MDISNSDVPTISEQLKIKKPTKKNISEELLNIIGLRSDVSNLAQQICEEKSMTIKKHKSKLHLLFYCLYRAHRLLGINISPKKIATLIGMDFKEISKSLKTYAADDEPYVPVKFTDYIPQHCAAVGISNEWIIKILEVGNSLRNLDPELDEDSPQKISAGLIYYFIWMYGIDCPIKKFKEVVDLSEVTITQTMKRIQHLHNVKSKCT